MHQQPQNHCNRFHDSDSVFVVWQMMGASNPPESRWPGAAGPRLSRRPVGRRSGVDPPFARSEWSDPGWCLVGTRARSYRVGGPKDAARSWARMRLYSGRMQQGLAYRGSTPRRARQKISQGGKKNDVTKGMTCALL